MRRGERALLLGVLAIEVAAFGAASPSFLTWGNAGELVRLSAELGLLSLAATCVIVTGGIDLSVGSLLGFCAILFGILVKDFTFPPLLAAAVTLLAGLLAGLLNGYLITKYRALPLIITLGAYSLYRGLAEGLTGGVRNFTGFPASFLFLGQGYWFGALPVQTPLFLLAIAAFWLLLHRTIIGRSLYAIGNSAPGARVAGLPVSRRLNLVYALSGLTSALAALVYVARVGQAKSDAGTGYELLAITAVVLGGTSILGGSGGISGTILGLLVIVVLQNGLRLAALPTELAGVLTGVVLLLVIGLEPFRAPAGKSGKGRLVWAAAGVAALVLSAFAAGRAADRGTGGGANHRTVVAMMPKAKGDPYFISCLRGAEEAAREFGVDLIWDGPTDLDPARQNDIVESWITRGVDVIAVSVENRTGISTVLRKARARGIKVLTWDADAERDARDFLVNQATPQGIGYAVTDQVAGILHEEGSFAIVTASLTAANQNEWMEHIRRRLADKYPRVKLETVRPSDGDRDRAFAETQTILRVYPQVKAIAGIAAPAVPGAAEAVKQAGRPDVLVTGLSLPSLCKPYVHAGVIRSVILWNTTDLGYLTVRAAQALHTGKLRPGATSLDAGRLHSIEVRGDEILLGAPFVFTKDNIDQFDF
jgi:rhamnose transport system substrate-binding protein